MVYKSRWIQEHKENNGDRIQIIYERRTSNKIVGYADTIRQALELIDELEKQTEIVFGPGQNQEVKGRYE